MVILSRIWRLTDVFPMFLRKNDEIIEKFLYGGSYHPGQNFVPKLQDFINRIKRFDQRLSKDQF